MKTNSIYPVEIYEWSSDINHDWIRVINKLPTKERETGILNAGPELHHDERFRPLVTWFEQCLYDIHQDKCFDCDGFKITSMWANRYRPGTRQEAHRHANSYWSAVYFLTDGAPLVFYDPLQQRSLGQWDIHTLPKITETGILENGPQIVKYTPTPGTLLIFPSWLVHDTEMAESDRYSISFNALPYGKINQGIANLDVI